MSSATLVKRFGSKDALLAKMSAVWVDSVAAVIQRSIATVSDPIDQLVAATVSLVRDLDHPERVVNQLAALAHDLQDERLRSLLHDGWFTAVDQLEKLVTNAVARQRVSASTDPRQIASMLVAPAQGTALLWSLRPSESLVEKLRRDAEVLLSSSAQSRPQRRRKESQ